MFLVCCLVSLSMIGFVIGVPWCLSAMLSDAEGGHLQPRLSDSTFRFLLIVCFFVPAVLDLFPIPVYSYGEWVTVSGTPYIVLFQVVNSGIVVAIWLRHSIKMQLRSRDFDAS